MDPAHTSDATSTASKHPATTSAATNSNADSLPPQLSLSLPGSDVEIFEQGIGRDDAASEMEQWGGRRFRKSPSSSHQASGTSGMPHSQNGENGRRSDHAAGQNPQSRSTPMLDRDFSSDPSSTATSDDVELRDLSPDYYSMDEDGNELHTNDSERKRRKQTYTNGSSVRRSLNDHIPSSIVQKSADRQVLKALAINAVLVGLWYLFSLSISLYNKWMFSEDHLNFPFPLFTTCFHMLVQFSLAGLVLYFVPHLRPKRDFDSDQLNAGAASKKPLMTKVFYLTRIGPCGAATGLDIGLGNMSLKFITLTFYTMCKSSSLAFVLSFAFLFRLETPSIKLVAIIVTMTIGVVMMVAGEVEFDRIGFVLVILAAFFSGFRWSLTQILLLRSPATSNPFSSIFFLAPVMFLSLAVIATPVEGLFHLIRGIGDLMSRKGVIPGIGILLFPGLIAFLMTASEFALLQRTSVVTLSVCGIFKEVATIAAAGIVFGDPLTPINVTGLMITIASIAGYNYIKITRMRSDARSSLNEPGPATDSTMLNDNVDEAGVGDEAAQPMLAASSTRDL